MLQLLERPAYQRAFGAGTAEQLQTIVTLGDMKWCNWMQLVDDGRWNDDGLWFGWSLDQGEKFCFPENGSSIFPWDGMIFEEKTASAPDRPRIFLGALSCDSDTDSDIEACGGCDIIRIHTVSLDTRQTYSWLDYYICCHHHAAKTWQRKWSEGQEGGLQDVRSLLSLLRPTSIDFQSRNIRNIELIRALAVKERKYALQDWLLVWLDAPAVLEVLPEVLSTSFHII